MIRSTETGNAQMIDVLLVKIRNGRIKKAVLLIGLAAFFIFMTLMPPTPRATAAPSGTDTSWIAADLAAGTDMTVIIGRAIASGMPVDGAVAAIINAGAAPGRVTYAAITANYPAISVVKGASTAVMGMHLPEAGFQTAVTLFFSAALQAGASVQSVRSGAQNAGMPPSVIAHALADAESGAAPVFGYTTPGNAGPTVLGGTLGGPGAPIGGSGIGSPSRQASPYKP